MLRAVPVSCFSCAFHGFDDDRQLAHIDVAWIRGAGTSLLEGASYKVARESLFGGAFVLEKDGQVVARATKPSVWRRMFEIEYGNKRYTLKTKSSFGRSFVLLDGEVTIGAMRPEHVFTRRSEADFPDSLPLPARIFMIWLTILLWKREADGSA